MTTPSSCAPVALFVYNRPAHTRRTLESLAANPESAETALTIYADGAKGVHDAPAVAAVRQVIRERSWCGRVTIHEAPENRGLAANILAGVNEQLAQAERVIVLEDDLELAPSFLRYMNQALECYAEEPRVLQISGYLPDLTVPLPDTFLLRTATSWGWATWRRAWSCLRTDAREMMREITASGREREFNLDGSYDFMAQLRANAEGSMRTWAVLWYASIYLAGGLVLHPRRSLVRNIGHDASGTHSQPDAHYHLRALGEAVTVEPLPPQVHAEAQAAVSEWYRRPAPSSAPRGWQSWLRRVWQRLRMGR